MAAVARVELTNAEIAIAKSNGVTANIDDQGTLTAPPQLPHFAEVAGPRHIFLQAGIPGW
jgi:hypothetical protein